MSLLRNIFDTLTGRRELIERVKRLESRSPSNFTLLRQALGGQVIGYWASDHFKESLQFEGWPYIAITAVMDHVRASKIVPDELNDRAHPMYEMTHHPNPEQSIGVYNECRTQQLMLTGVCVEWVVENQSGQLAERYVIPTGILAPTRQGFRITLTALQGITWSEYPTRLFSILSEIIPYENARVTRFPHPIHLGDGASPATAGRGWIDLAQQIDSSRFNVMANGARPGLSVKETGDAELDKEDRERFKKQLREKASGPENAGDHFYIPFGFEVAPWSLTSNELDHVNGFSQVRDAIMALYRVPPVAAGIMEASSHAEFYTAMLQMSELRTQPTLNRLAEADLAIFRQYVDDIPEEYGYLAHRIDDPDQKVAKLSSMKGAGCFTDNELREVWGYPDRPDCEEINRGSDNSVIGDNLSDTEDENGTGVKDPSRNGAVKIKN